MTLGTCAASHRYNYAVQACVARRSICPPSIGDRWGWYRWGASSPHIFVPISSAEKLRTPCAIFVHVVTESKCQTQEANSEHGFFGCSQARPERLGLRSQSVLIEQTCGLREGHAAVFRSGVSSPRRPAGNLCGAGPRGPAATQACFGGPPLRTPHAHAVYRKESEGFAGMQRRMGFPPEGCLSAEHGLEDCERVRVAAVTYYAVGVQHFGAAIAAAQLSSPAWTRLQSVTG